MILTGLCCLPAMIMCNVKPSQSRHHHCVVRHILCGRALGAARCSAGLDKVVVIFGGVEDAQG